MVRNVNSCFNPECWIVVDLAALFVNSGNCNYILIG